MTAAVLIFAVFILLLIIVPSSPGEEDPKPPRPRKPRDNQHFINSYLHRNDEKHERHKRNQTPW